MVGVNPGDGSRRRLPQWMLGISSAGQVKTAGNGKENGEQIEEGIQAREIETLGENSHVLVKCEMKRRKRKSEEHDLGHEGDIPETVPEKKGNGRGRRKVQQSDVPKREKAKDPLKCETKETAGQTKRRTRKSSEQDQECNDNVTETYPEKKCNGRGRIKVEKSDAPKRQKLKGSSCGSDEEQEVQISTDDDVELTVEDLVSIAEEYIKADGKMKQREALNQECESHSSLAERVSSANEVEKSVHAQNCNERSLIPDTTTPKPNGSLRSKEIGFSSSSMGDPAQDMLDLFLGPLLKKTVEKETKNQRLTEDVAFVHEIKRQSEYNVVREESATAPMVKKREEIAPAPIMKKKSSLKDKVAMFLD